MKAWEVIGYAVEADIFCPLCTNDLDAHTPILAGNNEADSQMYCASCGEMISTSITSKEGMIRRIAKKLLDEYNEIYAFHYASIEVANITIEIGYEEFETFLKAKSIDDEYHYFETHGLDITNLNTLITVLTAIFEDKTLNDIYIDEW